MNEWPMEYQAYGVTLKPLSQAMLETVRQWRNDPIIADLMLDKTHITAQMQQAWFDKLQGDKNRAYWVVYFKGEPIGVASLINICRDTKVCEPGMYVYAGRYRNNIVPFCIAFALNDFAFNVLGMCYLMGKIYQDNMASLRFHGKCGYQVYGKSEADLVLVKLDKNAYQIARDPLAKFIRY